MGKKGLHAAETRMEQKKEVPGKEEEEEGRHSKRLGPTVPSKVDLKSQSSTFELTGKVDDKSQSSTFFPEKS